MNFVWPSMLLSLLLVPLAVFGYRAVLGRRARQRSELGTMGLLRSSAGAALGVRRHVPFAFYLGALTLLAISFARPEMNVELPRREGTVVLAFDTSSSMIADDLEPNRMDAAKEAARVFVEDQPSSVRIAVAAFGEGAVVVQKPTSTKEEVLAAVERLSADGATSLGQGIFTSLEAIAEKPLVGPDGEPTKNLDEIDIGFLGSAVIVLLSDGENTALPDPIEMSGLAARAGVRIFPVGVGSAEGTVIEVDGYRVATVLDEALLQAVADETGGEYFFASDEADLSEIYGSIDLQLTTSGERLEVTAVLAGLGLASLLIGAGLSMRWFGRAP